MNPMQLTMRTATMTSHARRSKRAALAAFIGKKV